MSRLDLKYFSPQTMEEACFLLSRYKGEAKIVAGGTDLLVQIKHREVLPKYIINIRDIPGHDYIVEKGGVSIGALATIRSVASSSIIRERFPILSQGASKLGTLQVRNRGTIGGNLCNAAPSAETAPPLIVLGARAKIKGPTSERTSPIEDFFIGPGQTVLEPDEILIEIQVPNLLPRSGMAYMRQTIRKALDLAIVGVAVVITMDKDVIKDVKISLGAVAPTPIRSRSAEESLKGKRIEDKLLEKAGQIASRESSPISDVRSSADYRRNIVNVLVKRAIKQAVEQVTAG